MKKKLYKETFWSFASKGITFVLFFALNVYLARKLGVSQFGVWSFFLSVLTIIMLVSYLGINTSVKKFIAQYNKTEYINSVIRDSIKLRLVFSILFALILFIIAKPLADVINRPELATLFTLASPLVILATFTEFIKHTFEGLHRIKFNLIINVVEFGLKLLLVVWLFQVSVSLSNIINSYLIATLFASLTGIVLLYLNFYKPAQNQKSINFSKKILKYSMPLLVINLGFLIATEVDTFLLGMLSTDDQVGLFAAAKQIINKLPHISTAIAMGTMPIFAKLNDQNRGKLKKLFYRLLRINTYIYGSIAAIIVGLGWWFMPLIFGENFQGSALPLQILIVYTVGFSFSILLSNFLNYQGLAKRRAINLTITVILNIALNYFLIPRYGAVGAAIGTSVSYLPYVILNWLEVKSVLNKKQHNDI